MKYSIIIPTYNHCNDLLKPCIESIFKYTDMQDVELIISANGCTDNTKWYLDSLQYQFNSLGFGKNIKTLWSDTPLGYAGANNVAIQQATGEKIVLLNNDVILLEQPKNQWLEMLDSEFARNPKCGISCLIKDFSPPANAEFAIFFCVMIAKQVFDDVGLLNTVYGAGAGEDTEFCIEASKLGWEVCQVGEKVLNQEENFYVGAAPIYHKGEGTYHDTQLFPDWNNIFFRNSLILAKKYNPTWYYENIYQLFLSENSRTRSVPYIPEQVKREINFLGEIDLEIYNEVVDANVYQVSESTMNQRTVVDIGANIGCFSILASQLGAKNVYAVEPCTQTYTQLLTNIKRLNAQNITTIQRAITDQTDSLVILNKNLQSGHNNLFLSSTDTEVVKTITINDLIQGIDSSDIFLKLDCEGSEYDAILEATDHTMEKINEIVMELHEELHPTYKGSEIIEAKLQRLGFVQLNKRQLFSWTYDETGNRQYMRELPIAVHHWIKLKSTNGI